LIPVRADKFLLRGACLLALSALLAVAQAPAAHTNVVVDSNPAVFAVLAGLTAAGYDAGQKVNEPLREKLRQQIAAKKVPAVAALREFFRTHHLANRNQDLAQYTTLALFLGTPPGLPLTLPPAGLPPEAGEVADIVPLLRDFWQQADLDAVWEQAQPAYTAALQRDAVNARTMLDGINGFFRIPQAYSVRQMFVFPDALIAAGQSDALNYEDNYYIIVNLDLQAEMHQVRHTYLHYLLDPLIARYPAAILPVQDELLPLVARAPALGLQFKRDPTLLYTECLVRAVEIQLDGGDAAHQQGEVQSAMSEGLVLTRLWFDQLTKFRDDPRSFSEFYPEAAFALRISDLAGQVKHMQFTPAPAAEAAHLAQPLRAPSPMELAQARFDAKDYAAAAAIAHSVLLQPRGDYSAAWFLLGKTATAGNHAQDAVHDFQQALAVSRPDEAHIRTWSNIFLARLYDAEHQRAQAVAHYQAALTTADTDISKSLAKAGLKAPFQPPGVKHPD